MIHESILILPRYMGFLVEAGADIFLLGNLGHGPDSGPSVEVLPKMYDAPSPEAEDRVRFAEDLLAGKAMEAAFA